VKRIFLLLSVCITLCLVAQQFTSHAQQTTATDEVVLLPLPVPPNVIGTNVRGVSNDGKRIVFDSINDYNGRNVDSNTEIWVYDVDSRSIIQITDTADIRDPADTTKRLFRINNFTPAISGDGTKITFVSNADLGDATNDDRNFEVYLANLPRNATTATVTRITNTGADYSNETVKEIFSNYTPTISDDGAVISFVSTRRNFNAIDNGAAQFTAVDEAGGAPDGNGEIFIYNVASRRYTQVTATRDVDATVNFVVRGFNSSPRLSGDGRRLVFLSGFNYAGTNANRNTDFNGEIYIHSVGDPLNSFTQVTETSGTAITTQIDFQTGIFFVPGNAPVNLLHASSRPFNRDGSLLTFESSGNLDNSNSDRTREVWLYNVNTRAFTKLTNQSISSTPSQDELRRVDYTFQPNINSTGTHITFTSVLNLTPATSGSGVRADNADASREVFRYDIARAQFRQITYTGASNQVFDQRDNITDAFADATGNLVTFGYDANLIAASGTTVRDLFQGLVRPVATKNAVEAKLANAASFDATQIARGSIAAVFGMQLANTTLSATSGNLPFELGGVTVTVNGVAGRLIFVSPEQVNFVVPNIATTGDAIDVTINNNGLQSAGKVKLVAAAPGVFTATGDGKGASAVQCGRVSPDGLSFLLSAPPCAVGNSAQANVLVIYGTGFRNATGVQVRIGDQTLTPTYAGPQNDFIGLDQINVNLTAELAGKTGQEITVVVPTNVESNKSTVSFREGIDPVITLLNAASFESGVVARGSLVTIQGTDLANSTRSFPTPVTNADGVQVTAAGLAALINYISPTQINFRIPSEVQPADLVEVVVNNNGKISRGRVRVLNASPGIFTTTDDGNGQARVQCGRVNADGSITFSSPPCAVGTEANPNIIRVFGTGWANAESVTLKVGDVNLMLNFSGPLSGALGIDIIDAKLTPALANRTDQDVIVTTKVGTTEKASKAGIKVSFAGN
jgi:uncharacterized protein (TIGR03437 family)